MNPLKIVISVIVISLATFTAEAGNAKTLQGCVGTYSGAPRLQNGHVDTDRLLAELKENHVNTYNWLIYYEHDWADLKPFLPKARHEKIKVWVTLIPPSESKPHSPFYSEPFRLDYARWAVEIAQLSRAEKNLVVWSIDDFAYDLDTFTPEATRKMLDEVHAINPKLAFVPCLYFGQIKSKLLKNYGQFFDGILFPFRDESSHKANTSNAESVTTEIETLRQRLGTPMPIVVDVYATKHSQYPVSNAEYVKDVIAAAAESADGVMIYCHQDKATNPEKYEVIKTSFNAMPKKAFSSPHRQPHQPKESH